MTEFEARVILGLQEDDPIYIEGLKYFLDETENRLASCPIKYEKPKLRREIKAANKLLSLYG